MRKNIVSIVAASLLTSVLVACGGGGGGGTPAPTVTLNSSSTSVYQGDSVTLTWASTNATSCTASDGWIGSLATSGTSAQTPISVGQVTYTITCTGIGGSAAKIVNLTVAIAPTPIIYHQNSFSGKVVNQIMQVPVIFPIQPTILGATPLKIGRAHV